MRIVLVKLELQEQNIQLRRIADALERLAGPPLKAYDKIGRKSDLSDLTIVDAAALQQIADIEAAVAVSWDSVPGSEDYQRKKKVFEDAVRVEAEAVQPGSGQKEVDALPWNSLRRKSQ